MLAAAMLAAAMFIDLCSVFGILVFISKLKEQTSDSFNSVCKILILESREDIFDHSLLFEENI